MGSYYNYPYTYGYGLPYAAHHGVVAAPAVVPVAKTAVVKSVVEAPAVVKTTPVQYTIPTTYAHTYAHAPLTYTAPVATYAHAPVVAKAASYYAYSGGAVHIVKRDAEATADADAEADADAYYAYSGYAGYAHPYAYGGYRYASPYAYNGYRSYYNRPYGYAYWG